MPTRFRDRRDAGRQLALLLKRYTGRQDTLVLALPRGGVPVGFEVASALGAPLDVFLVRKLGVPEQPELAMGAIASGGLQVLNQDVIEEWRVPAEAVAATIQAEQRELARREQLYRGERGALDPAGLVVLLIDDGLATGASMVAATIALYQLGAAQIVVAVPVSPRSTLAALRGRVDHLFCALIPAQFNAVGKWYEDFSQTSDDEVRQLLALAWSNRQRAAGIQP